MTKDIVILSAARTAIGTFGGSLSGIAPCDLATTIATEAIARSGLEGATIGQTVMGNVIHTEPRDMYLSRVAAIGAGVPETSPALTLNRLCGSGLQAVVSASEASWVMSCMYLCLNLVYVLDAALSSSRGGSPCSRSKARSHF